MDYTARSPIIINYTILAGSTWEKASSAIQGVRKWLVKARESTNNEFRMSFVAAPTTYVTNSGVGLAFDNCELPNIYVYGTVGTVVEILYWN